MVGWLFILIHGYLWDDGPVEDISIGAVFSQMIAKASRSHSLDNLHHPVLTSAEHTSGCHLGIDTWADTMCSGKHAFVEEFVEGKSVTATGFTPSLGSLPSLPIANVYMHMMQLMGRCWSFKQIILFTLEIKRMIH